MKNFDAEQARIQFHEGKSLLDSGAYTQAITLYDRFIPANQAYLEIPEARNLVRSALNNRGVAKCKYALRYDDEALYRNGINDFQESIAMGDEISKQAQDDFSHTNLRLAEQEVKSLQGKQPIDPNSLPWYISK